MSQSPSPLTTRARSAAQHRRSSAKQAENLKAFLYTWDTLRWRSEEFSCAFIKTIQRGRLNVWQWICSDLKAGGGGGGPWGEIWLALLLRTGTSLTQCTSTVAKFHSRAPSSDSDTGTRRNLSSGAEMHLIIYSSFRDCPRVLSISPNYSGRSAEICSSTVLTPKLIV